MPEFNEEYYFEQFGVSPKEEDPGEETPEENISEAPQEDANDEPVDAQPDEPDQGAEKPKQSKKENAQFAAARRKAEKERDEAIAAARQQFEKDQDALIADMGLENPYNGKPITNKAEYDEYKATHAQKEQEQRLRDMDMTQEEYDQYVSDLPEVKEARQFAEAQRKKFYEDQLNQEVSQITALNPAIKSIQDIAALPKYNEIYDKVTKQNYNLVDAYKLVYFDDLASRRGRQQAINHAGKSHLTSTQARGGEGPVNVPRDELDMFHRLIPDATDDEIGKFYNRMIQKE